MNEHEVERIAGAIHALRPDWPAASLRTLIAKKLGDRPCRDVAVALAWVACEPGTATPARVLESGPWWKAAGVEGSPNPITPYDRDSFCATCGRPEYDCRLNEISGHEFESATDQARRLAAEPPKPPIRALVEETP